MGPGRNAKARERGGHRNDTRMHGPAEATSLHSSGCWWLKLRIWVWCSPSSHSHFGSISCCQNTGCPSGTGPHRGQAWGSPRWGRCPAFLRYLLLWSQRVASWTLDLSIEEMCGQGRLIESLYPSRSWRVFLRSAHLAWSRQSRSRPGSTCSCPGSRCPRCTPSHSQ